MYYIMMTSYKYGFTRQMPDGALDLFEAVNRAELYADRNHDCQFTVVNEEGDIILELYEG